MKASSSVNPKDAIRDQILRELYDFSQKSRSAKSVAVLPSVLAKALKKKHGYKLQEVASNLDYLVEKGWVKELIEKRTFQTQAGTIQNSERRTYKISASGVDRLEAASLFKKVPAENNVNITNINGVTIVGDGNVVNTKFTDVSRVLSEIRSRVASDTNLTDEMRLNALSDIDGLTTQIQKPNPNPVVVKALWEGVKAAVTVGSAVELIHKAGQLLGLLTH